MADIFGETCVRSLPLQTDIDQQELDCGNQDEHSSMRSRSVIKMLVGELNSRVRRKPMKPSSFTGADVRARGPDGRKRKPHCSFMSRGSVRAANRESS